MLDCVTGFTHDAFKRIETDGGRGGSGEGGGGGEVPREGRVDATCESIYSQIDLIA